MEEKMRTLHPRGKRGVNISRAKYEVMKRTILGILRSRELTHTELTEAVKKKLRGTFEGSVAWYMESTKLDLEARGLIERVPGERYQAYRVKR